MEPLARSPSLNSMSGFSLIELMITIAIIGLMSSVAVPTYKSMSRRATQTQVKTLLLNLYQAESIFHNEYETYSPRLDAIGFTVEGQLDYVIGFSVDNPAVIPGAPPGSPTCLNLGCSAATQCTYPKTWTCSKIAQQTVANVFSLAVGAQPTATQNAFAAAAHSHFDGITGQDAETWIINEKKQWFFSDDPTY